MLAAGLRASPPAAEQPDPRKAGTPLAQIAGAAAPGPAPATGLLQQPEARAHYEAALAHLERKEFNRAVAELDAALNLAHEPDYEVLYLLARTKHALGHDGEARFAAEHAAVYRPGGADVHLLLGRLHRKQGRLEAASANLRTATLAAEREPNNPQVTVAWYELGSCLAEAGYLCAAAEALERFDRAVWEERPDQRQDVEVAAILAEHPYGTIEQRLELWRRLDRPAELARAAEWAFQTRPDEPYLERLYVRTLLDAGQARAAFEFCTQRLLASSASEGPPTFVLLTLAIENGRAAGRLAAWVSQLAEDLSDGRHVALAEHLARRLDAENDYSVSIPLWRALAAAQPEVPASVWALASALKESGDLAAAVDALIGFVRKNQGSAEIPPEWLAAWMRSFRVTDDFLRLVQELSTRQDCDFATYTILGALAAAAGQTELAERLFGSALESRPAFALAHVAWARMLLAAYRWDEALEHANQALAVAPDLAAAHFLRAEAYAGLDEHEEAEREYKAAVEASPSEVAYVLALARRHHRTANLLAAQRYLQQAWSMDRTQAAAVEELVDCYLEGGKVEIARTCLKEAEASDIPDDTLRRIRTAVRFVTASRAEYLAELARQFAQFPDEATTGLKLGAGLYVDQRPDEAVKVLEQVQARARSDERLTPLLAQVYLRRLEHDKATALLEEALRCYPRRRNLLRLLAGGYLADFRVAQARQTWQRLLELEPAGEQRNQWRAALLGTYVEWSEFDAGLELVTLWLNAEPGENAWERAKMRLLVAAGRGEQAVALAAERLRPATRHFEQTLERCKDMAERLRGKPDDAETQAQLKNLERELGAAVAGLYERRSDYVDVCLNAGRYQAAEEQLGAWLKDQPGQPQLQEWLIEVLLAAKCGAEALGVIDTLVPKTQTDYVKALLWKARAAAGVEKREDGINLLKGLLEEGFMREDAAARAQVRQEIVTLLVDAQEYEPAVALCDRWLVEAPADDRAARVGILTLKRAVLSTADRPDEHIAVMKELLEIQPHDPGLNNDLGYTWVDRGEQLERSLAMIKLAVAAEPQNAAFLDSLGWAYYKLGDFDGARKYLARAVQLRRGQDATVYDHLGDAEYRLGDGGAARQHWQKALGLLEEAEAADRVVRGATFMAVLRGKLSALEKSVPPALAPTAAEQERGQRP